MPVEREGEHEPVEALAQTLVPASEQHQELANDDEPISVDDRLQTTPSTKRELPSAADLDHMVQLREAYGLSTDRDFVRSLYDAPEQSKAVKFPFGLLSEIRLSEDEREHAKRRAVAEWVGGEVDKVAFDALAGYAGTVINSDASVTVLCARCDPTTVQRSLVATSNKAWAGVPQLAPGELRVKEVDYSANELKSIGAESSYKLSEAGIRSYGSVDVGTCQRKRDSRRVSFM